MFDPIELADVTKRIVVQNSKRKYYRFRYAGFYGGIATADCVGCNLRCAFCWAWNVVHQPDKIGKFYSPEEVAEKLSSVAEKKGAGQVRISGNEPTITKEHLLAVLDNIPQELRFILETNGTLIGYDESYAKDLASYKNLHVRVSLKGSSPEEFSKLTGAKPDAYELQFKALENLIANGVSCHPAIMTFEHNEYVKKRLEKIDPTLPAQLEEEYLIRYPAVLERLRRLGIM